MSDEIFDDKLTFLMTPERRIREILHGARLVRYPEHLIDYYFKNDKWLFDFSYYKTKTSPLNQMEDMLWVNHYELIAPLEAEFNISNFDVKVLVYNFLFKNYVFREIEPSTELKHSTINEIEYDLKMGRCNYVKKYGKNIRR